MKGQKNLGGAASYGTGSKIDTLHFPAKDAAHQRMTQLIRLRRDPSLTSSARGPSCCPAHCP